MKLRPETIVRRQVELQVSLRYAQEVRALKLRVAELEASLLEASVARPCASDCRATAAVAGCRCSWCSFVQEAISVGRAQCAFSEFRKAEESTTEQVTLHPQG